ncbi:putative zinc metalloprotease [Mollisia scopiformis]|uniref:Peptide hydrolase n=1 Tax=Mollisia scopiformis TaxID=149040 RepID=A0A194XPI9_MOLSC|nr:putative zinc metalloprotease [Mollisia scopiformis]KUJ22165.1 putative zinc metalloprotease [Mollisia scopiformis]
MVSSLYIAGSLLASLIPSNAKYQYSNSSIPSTNLYPTDSWTSGQVGISYTTQLPDTELTTILQEIDPLRIQAIIEKLVSFGTRHTLSTQTDPGRGIGAARDWLLGQYKGFAEESEERMEIELQSYVQGVANRISFLANISNVVATLKGSGDPERIVVISGHYDSRNTDVMNFVDDAPGADDDASGVAISLELTRVMAKHRPTATIIFAAVAGEEQGLYGSTYLAQLLSNHSANVEGMWTNDIVGSPVGDDGKNHSNIVRLFAQGVPTTETSTRASQRLSIGGENDSPARQLGRFTRDVASNNVTGMNVELIYRADRYLRGGDHMPFLRAGYPAVRFTEPRENFAHQHQDVRVSNGMQFGDLPEFCDFNYIARVGRVTGAAVWSLAMAPDMPKNVTIDAKELTNDSELRWEKVVGAKGYEVLWRGTSERDWGSVLEVGDVSGARIGVSKDNMIFGVRSVGSNGYKSPAVFPFPG